MKVLIVCSGNKNRISPFVQEQVQGLEKQGIECTFFLVTGKGAFGYLKNFFRLRNVIRRKKPQIVHAHFGLCGALAGLQRIKPVVVTYHGSDINNEKNLRFSRIAMKLARCNIFVSEALAQKAKAKEYVVLPCGIDFSVFYPMEKDACRRQLGWKNERKYILFSSSFDNTVKNHPLAQQAVLELGYPDAELVELKGLGREQVALYMNACDVALMTSFSEGSPQFIKEAMACNCPIVTTDVGDVRTVIGHTKGCFIASPDSAAVSDALKQALAFGGTTNGRDMIGHLDNTAIASAIRHIYARISG